MLATNIAQDDEPTPATRWFCRNAVMWSYAYIQKVKNTQPPGHPTTQSLKQSITHHRPIITPPTHRPTIHLSTGSLTTSPTFPSRVAQESLKRGVSKEQLAERFVAVEMRVSKAVSTMLEEGGPRKRKSEKAGNEETGDKSEAQLDDTETLLKVHSNSLITDASYMIRSSSNLIDRSIWNKVRLHVNF